MVVHSSYRYLKPRLTRSSNARGSMQPVLKSKPYVKPLHIISVILYILNIQVTSIDSTHKSEAIIHRLLNVISHNMSSPGELYSEYFKNF